MTRFLAALALACALSSAALAIVAPAEAARQRRPRTVCEPTYEPGVGYGHFCATAPRRH